MTTVVRSFSMAGFDAREERITVEATGVAPSLTIVGLAPAAEREIRVRVTSALAQIGVYPEVWLKVTLEERRRKSAASLDLAIAMGILAELGRVPRAEVESSVFIGDISLTGRIQPVRGVLAMLEARRGRAEAGSVFVPLGNHIEAGFALQGVIGTPSLEDVIRVIGGGDPVVRCLGEPGVDEWPPFGKTALSEETIGKVESAAAARRPMLLIGVPGSGKVLLARHAISMLGAPTKTEALSIVRMSSIAGLYQGEGVIKRPFRAPHHTVSEAGLSGSPDRPGEVHLAAHGVLFLDEIHEFRRSALESLDRSMVGVSSAPLLVGSASPCPCGFHGHPRRVCKCTLEARKRFEDRMTGGIFDRFEERIYVELK